MNNFELVESLRTAWARGERPAVEPGANLQDADLREADLQGANLRAADLCGANLWDSNLWEADLQGAYLQGANLWEVNLQGANLRGADLRDANLGGASLQGADLWGANLRGADLGGTNLGAANLRGADLRGANLWDANLWETDLWDTAGGILQVAGLHPYPAVLVPTVQGWRLRIGCWKGNTQDLRDLIAQDDGWPEAKGDQITARRPLLNVLADMCDLHATHHQDELDTIMQRWSDEAGRP